MATTTGLNGITFGDGTTQNTAAIAVDTNTSSTATNYAIGTTVITDNRGVDLIINLNSANTIYYVASGGQGTSFQADSGTSALTGTWRCRGAFVDIRSTNEGAIVYYSHLFQRTA